MRNSLRFLIIFSLFQGICGDFGNNKEQQKIASKPQLENNFGETPGESVITAAITGHDEDFDDNELGKLFMQNFKLYKEISERQRNRNGSSEMLLRRKTRITGIGEFTAGIKCFSCSATKRSNEYSDCYTGLGLSEENCFLTQLCYVALHPLHIKRGCIYPDRVNRTFYCKCPMCNDKPSYNTVYYEYERLRDWHYDNERLKRSIPGEQIICKRCETTGLNHMQDSVCINGKYVDYSACGVDELCYTNIDDEVGHISRGCVSKPVFNTFYSFCNETGCNNGSYIYKNPGPKPPEEVLFRTQLSTKKKKKKPRSGGSKNFQTSVFLLLNIILFNLFQKVTL